MKKNLSLFTFFAVSLSFLINIPKTFGGISDHRLSIIRFENIESQLFQTKPIPREEFQNSQDFIFEKVLEYKKLPFQPNIPRPIIRLQGETPLSEFQDSIEKQWGQRPAEFTNAYSIKDNKIFLIDQKLYYRKNARCIDDSLAHELTHYFQDRYQHFDLNDDSLEAQAIEIQTWFRENFCQIP